MSDDIQTCVRAIAWAAPEQPPLLRRAWLHRLFGRSRLFRAAADAVSSRLELAVLAGHKDRGTLSLIGRVRRERELLMGAHEAFMLCALARAQSRLGGEMAEVGVYQGGSAKLISVASRGAALHLFDTFDGLPAPGAAERPFLRQGQYRERLAPVAAYLRDCANVRLHPGEFPGTSGACDDARFSLVHLDVDLQASTRAGLEFFYPRMLPGGVILTHDYSVLNGVRRACDEFLAERRERMIELATSQAMLVKL